jgi:AAT family amino acid transporter
MLAAVFSGEFSYWCQLIQRVCWSSRDNSRLRLFAGLKYKMWLCPVSSYFALAFLVLLTVLFYVFKLQPNNLPQSAARSVL